VRIALNVCDFITEPEEVMDVIYAQMREFLAGRQSGCISLDLTYGDGQLCVDPAGLTIVYGEPN
jgi:hypothetical protein